MKNTFSLLLWNLTPSSQQPLAPLADLSSSAGTAESFGVRRALQPLGAALTKWPIPHGISSHFAIAELLHTLPPGSPILDRMGL